MMYITYADAEKNFVVGLYIARTERRWTALRKWLRFPRYDQAHACFRGYATNFKKIINGKQMIGCIVLRMSKLEDPHYRGGVIAHECMHATVQYLRKRRKWSTITKELGVKRENRLRAAGTPEEIPEELLAYTLGRITEQVTRAVKQDRRYKR